MGPPRNIGKKTYIFFTLFRSMEKVGLKCPQMGPGGFVFLLIQTLPTFWAERILISRIYIFFCWIPNFQISRFHIFKFPEIWPGPGLGLAWARLGTGLGPAWAHLGEFISPVAVAGQRSLLCHTHLHRLNWRFAVFFFNLLLVFLGSGGLRTIVAQTP